MKISFIREKMVSALSILLRVVSTQVTLPILSNIKISCDDARLKISATDLELGTETIIGAKISKKGSISIPAKLFFEFLSSINEEKIDLEVKDNKAIIKGKKIHTIIKGLPSDDFPLIPQIKDKIIEFTINAQEIKDAISNCVFACALDETRPVLTGILLKIEKNNFIFTATDSYRLCETKYTHKQKIKQSTQVIIPRRTMVELSRIIGEKDENIKIEIGENQIAFFIGDIYFISRLIEGSFPEYNQIIPKKFKTTIVLDNNEFANNLKTASLFSKDSANNIKIDASIKEKNIVIKSHSQQLGENKSKLDAISIDGSDISFSVNASYLQETLNVFESDKVSIGTIDKESPILITSKEKLNYFCIIMPLRQED
jgi:DNA polymerase-3 subunit beta